MCPIIYALLKDLTKLPKSMYTNIKIYLYNYSFRFTLHTDIVDFVPEEDGILRFGQGRNKECINITIIADLQVEQTESFDVLLERRNDTHERILVVRGKTTVNIINDDGKSIRYSYCCNVIPVYCTCHTDTHTHTHTSI